MAFNVGDLVQLKSGGPVMTVQSIDPRGNEGLWCQWFSGKKLERGHFKQETLVSAKDE